MASCWTTPGASVQSCYHVMGTAREWARRRTLSCVVDDGLRVHGIAGLRIVDASIMPNMPSANLCAATMMIAEKAADLIRGRQTLPSEPALQSVS